MPEESAHGPAGDSGVDRRELKIAETFVTLADTMVQSYDVIEYLDLLAERCVELLPTDEAGIMLADQRGNLQAVASSSERTRVIELYELQSEEGPCLDAFRTGDPVFSADLRQDDARWPRFVPRAVSDGFGSVFSWPLRVRTEVIGALNLFGNEPATFSGMDRALAGALANIATIGLLQQRAIEASRETAEQLQIALSSRVLIEQAKGVIAERHDLSIDEAFARLRRAARDHRRTLTSYAAAVVNDQLDIP